jgi:hypothetical protein
MLKRFGIIEDDPQIFLPLRRMREEWLLRNIQTATRWGSGAGLMGADDEGIMMGKWP